MDHKTFVEEMESKYFLIKKGKWWNFLGGAFAFLVAAGLISYSSTIQAINTSKAKQVTSDIEGMKKDSQKQLENIDGIISKFTDPTYNPGWTLVYENDSDGQTLNGDLNSLVEAIRNGADVKIYTNEQGRESSAICEWAFVDTSTGELVVTCMNTSHVSIRKTAGENFGFQDRAYHWFVMINTKGKRDMSRWLVGQHTALDHNQTRLPVKWFARFL